MIYLVLIGLGLLVVYVLLSYLDSRCTYNDIKIYKLDKENNEFYFYVPVYIWQKNKAKKAIEVYAQGKVVEVQGYKYELTNFRGEFRTNNGLFFERELRFGAEPLRILWSNKSPQITIYQYGSGNISITLNNNEFLNEIVNVREYISQDTNIDGFDKEIMQDFINKILNTRSMESGEFNKAYNTFLKYEPLLSFALNFFTVIKDFIVK